MKRIQGYRCTLCGREYPFGPELYTCPACGEKGILDIVYDYKAVQESLNRETLAACRDFSMWRYRALMPVADATDVSQFLRIGWSPLYKSLRLGQELELGALYIKDDGINPTGSLKDRASGVAVAKAMELGYDTISCSSTGNAASSCAGSAARMGLKAVIFVPKRAPQGKIAQLMIFGARLVVVDGDYEQTFELSRAAIEKYGWYNRNAGINPVMSEGKKTVAMEIAEQLGFNVPDWVACSVGDGCTIGGVYTGFKDLYKLGLIDRIPRILGVLPLCGCGQGPGAPAGAHGREYSGGFHFRRSAPEPEEGPAGRIRFQRGLDRRQRRGYPFRHAAAGPYGGSLWRTGRGHRYGGGKGRPGKEPYQGRRDRSRYEHRQRPEGCRQCHEGCGKSYTLRAKLASA